MCAFGTSNKQPRGAALIIVMLVMAVLLMAGVAFLTISSTESQIALNEQASARALVLAEAAIHKAITQLNAGVNYGGEPALGEPAPQVGGGSFTTSVTTMAGCTTTSARKILATGSVPVRGGTAQVQLEVVADRVAYPYRWAAFAGVPNQIIGSLDDPLARRSVDRTNSELWLSDTLLVDSFDSGAGPYDGSANSGPQGDVGANGNVNISYNTTIDGKVQAGDDVSMSSSVTVTGGPPASGLSPLSTDPGVWFPAVTTYGDPTTSGVSPTSYLTSTGGLKVPAGGTVTLDGGTKYFTNITMGDGATLRTHGGTVTIILTGPPISKSRQLADVGNNVTVGAHPGTQLQVIAKSDGDEADHRVFAAQDGFRFYGSLYGTNTDIYLGANSQVFGSIIGRTILIRHASSLHYDQAMSNQEVCHNGRFTIRRGSWREVIPST